ALEINDAVSWRLKISRGDHALESAGNGSLWPPLWIWFLRALGSLVDDEGFELPDSPDITDISHLPGIVKDAADMAAPRATWPVAKTDLMLCRRYEAGIEFFGKDSQGRGIWVAVTQEGKVMGIRRTGPSGEVPEEVSAALTAWMPGFEPMHVQTVGTVDGPAL